MSEATNGVCGFSIGMHGCLNGLAIAWKIFDRFPLQASQREAVSIVEEILGFKVVLANAVVATEEVDPAIVKGSTEALGMKSLLTSTLRLLRMLVLRTQQCYRLLRYRQLILPRWPLRVRLCPLHRHRVRLFRQAP